jgi:hypothetical protein
VDAGAIVRFQRQRIANSKSAAVPGVVAAQRAVPASEPCFLEADVYLA